MIPLRIWFESFVYSVSVHMAFALVPAYLYSRSMLRGISIARREDIRVTPQTPWSSVDAELRPTERIISYGLIPWLVIETAVQDWHCWWYMWTFGLENNNYLFHLMQDFLSTLGLIGLILSGIVIHAPERRTSFSLMISGAVPGTILWIGIEWWNWSAVTWTSYLDEGLSFLIAVFGVWCFFYSWHFVRYKLDRKWFRFDV